jgi:membrane associated rhomboid family serine protease
MNSQSWRRNYTSRYGYGGGFGGIGPSGPVPPMVRTLIVINVGVYLLQAFGLNEFLIEQFALFPALVSRLQIWRLFTYQFLHGGVWHVAINMFMLWMFGSELEQRWGQRFFLRYYFLCAVGGGLAFTIAMHTVGDPRTASVGASGAIYGILMAYGMWFPNRKVFIWFLFPISVRYLVVFLIAIEFLQSIESSGSGIAHAAHFGGMVIGYFYLRWWGASGLGLNALPSLRDIRRAYYRWRFRRLQKKRLGESGRGPTYH